VQVSFLAATHLSAYWKNGWDFRRWGYNHPMLQLLHVAKAYEQKLLLKDVSFKVDEGETICLLGASGSGKSTLLRMIAGLEFPERGSILFNGIDLAPLPPHLRDFGLVFQDYGLFPHLNVADNVAFGLKMREKLWSAGARSRRSRQQAAGLQNERVAEMLEMVNLQGFDKRRVTELSGGEQQRVALARALAVEPRLLMFDEPLGALDKTLKEDLLNELRMILHKTKIPAIYVTHDQEEAFAIADRILLLHDGEIIRDGAPAEVWAHPDSIHAAKMLGIGNVVEGRMNDEGGGMKVKTNIGVFESSCKHAHKKDEVVALLIKQSTGGGNIELQAKVEDVIFKRDGFEVRCGNGLIFHAQEAPQIGEALRVKVEVECLG
jgi:ABC-type Fe3+/spermidine/putrescine transport system ATPase subunit